MDMHQLLLVLAVITGGVLFYIYAGYGILLGAILKYIKASRSAYSDEYAGDGKFNVTVILPVYNEEAVIRDKLENILEQAITGELEIIVVSDGSTDKTNEIVEGYEERNVKLVVTEGRCGKSVAQNYAVKYAKHEILLLTDAAAHMERGCVSELLKAFNNENVGCATGNLLFRSSGGSVVDEDLGYFWKYELKLRNIESRLGWLAVTSGPLMALRRELWVPLQSWYGDDCVIPLDVILQGYKVVHVPNSIAWDESFSTYQQEYRARVRMTVRNLHGTFYRKELLNPFKWPQYAFALISHKILRWLSPVWVILLYVAIVLLLVESGVSINFILTITAMFMAFGVLVVIAGIRIPVISTGINFMLVNYAFLVGLFKAIGGRKIRMYHNT